MKAEEYNVVCGDRFVSAAIDECLQDVNGTVSDLSALEDSAETLDNRHMER